MVTTIEQRLESLELAFNNLTEELTEMGLSKKVDFTQFQIYNDEAEEEDNEVEVEQEIDSKDF